MGLRMRSHFKESTPSALSERVNDDARPRPTHFALRDFAAAVDVYLASNRFENSRFTNGAILIQVDLLDFDCHIGDR
jgi:hypothetical protein